MKKLTIAAIAVLALTAIAPAQDYSSISSGPWELRKSTGDHANDRFWFIADRTLNAAEKDDLRMMFQGMPGGSGLAVREAILRAIDNNVKANTSYGRWMSVDQYSDNGMSDIQVYDAMVSGLNYNDRGGVYMWEEKATSSQMSAVGKLVRMGGWANSMWTTSPLNKG